ncbi:hypothetical protein [Thalassotalea piscium]|uniref:Uncharacterized protein n=1 Tax=Thalassotalea piscium TaxID=1230533 RepID=A0A7X0NFJ9_9GAMM|nr:hypothetical protein [Thalassotalea piscium]MBB6542532.1 hypothetical protein [Thalassotalea piscium]
MEFLLYGMALMASIMVVGYFIIEYFYPVGKDKLRHWRFSKYYKVFPDELK